MAGISKTVPGQIEQGMISGFCHKTKGGSTQRNGRAILSEQIKIQLNPGSSPAAQLVGGKHGAWAGTSGQGALNAGLADPEEDAGEGSHCTFILYLIFLEA